jgi:hypothetical protein
VSDIPGDDLNLPPVDGPDADEVFALLDQMEAEEKAADAAAPDAPSSPAERRQHPRTPPHGHVPATITREGAAPARLSVRDLSRSGVGLFSPSPMPEGQLCNLTLEPAGTANASRPALRASCRIASCRLSPDGRYILGLQFLSITR